MSVFLLLSSLLIFLFFFFNDTATTEIYTLSLHDALPISFPFHASPGAFYAGPCFHTLSFSGPTRPIRKRRTNRSEEHTSELQSPCNLVCRLLLEKKKKKNQRVIIPVHNQVQ